MKLRIMGNSLRLRLSQTEVDTLGREGMVKDTIAFPANEKLTYEIRSSESDTLGCTFANNNISLFVPQIVLNEWIGTDMVGFDREIDLDKNKKLGILIEKDFKCLTKRPNEDDSELYPNPLKSH